MMMKISALIAAISTASARKLTSETQARKGLLTIKPVYALFYTDHDMDWFGSVNHMDPYFKFSLGGEQDIGCAIEATGNTHHISRAINKDGKDYWASTTWIPILSSVSGANKTLGVRS